MDVAKTATDRATANNVHVLTHGNNTTGADNIDTRSSMNGGSRPFSLDSIA